MKKIKFFLLSALLFLCISCFGQTGIKISKPRLSLIGNNIIIKYDILNSSPIEKFRVWIEVTDTAGNRIILRNYIGDLGENISGGDNKSITWDYSSDGINIENGIFVQIFAEVLSSPTINDVLNPKLNEVIKPEEDFKRGGVILRSAIFPGWGLSKIGGCKLHLLKGAAGYGCIAASVVYNKMANSNYNKYLASENLQDIDNFFNTSVKQDRLSEIFGYTAIGIWVADIIWTIATPLEKKTGGLTGQAGKIMIYPDFAPGIKASGLTFRLNF